MACATPGSRSLGKDRFSEQQPPGIDQSESDSNPKRRRSRFDQPSSLEIVPDLHLPGTDIWFLHGDHVVSR